MSYLKIERKEYLQNIAFAFKFNKRHPSTPMYIALVGFTSEDILNEMFSLSNIGECPSCNRDTNHVCLCELEHYIYNEYKPINLHFP